MHYLEFRTPLCKSSFRILLFLSLPRLASADLSGFPDVDDINNDIHRNRPWSFADDKNNDTHRNRPWNFAGIAFAIIASFVILGFVVTLWRRARATSVRGPFVRHSNVGAFNQYAFTTSNQQWMQNNQASLHRQQQFYPPPQSPPGRAPHSPPQSPQTPPQPSPPPPPMPVPMPMPSIPSFPSNHSSGPADDASPYAATNPFRHHLTGTSQISDIALPAPVHSVGAPGAGAGAGQTSPKMQAASGSGAGASPAVSASAASASTSVTASATPGPTTSGPPPRATSPDVRHDDPPPQYTEL